MNTRQPRIRFHRWQGFTLVELMIALAVAVILVVIAIPSFSNIVRDNRMASAVNALAGAIHLARMEAVRRNTWVTVCKSANANTNNPTCTTNGNWEQGWIVFTDLNNNGQFNDDGDNNLCEPNEDCRLRIYDGIGGNIVITGSTNVADYVTFSPSGWSNLVVTQQNNADETFKICDDRAGNFGRQLEIVFSGRLRLRRNVSCP